MMEPKVSFLIVGQGLAGTLAGHFLEKHGYSFIIMDEPHEMTSSKVAAGMFNPLNGKRMVKNWKAEIIIPFAIKTYQEIEQKLSCSILHQLPIHHVLGSVKEQNDLSLKADNVEFMQFIEMDSPKINFVKEPWGSFQISQSGWVNTPLLLGKYAQYCLSLGKLLHETMDYSLLRQQDDGTWKYKNLHANNILFCEGHRYHLNPFFTDIPYEPTKGDVLTIKCVGLPHDKIIKKGIYLVHLGNDLFKVGATYDRVNIHNNPDPKAREEIIKDLVDLIDKPFEVIKHEAGIRPTMRDRNPLAQAHPEIKNMFILNGLGSKGVMLGPWFANQLMNVISESKE